jgi:DNA-binding response OmpR family regulator
MNTCKRLLIVDDEPDFADFVAKVAGDLGYDAVMTTTANAFRSEYLAALPDVIVLDIVMPEQDGIETIKWLVGRGCRARILIISGYNPTFAFAAKLIGEVQGNLDVSQLQKPIKVAELRAQLQAAAA